MAKNQADSIRDLLIQALLEYDPNLDLNTNTTAYSKIVSPIYNALSPDPLDTDIEDYLMQVLRTEYPSLEVQEGDVLVDLLVRPLQILLEPLKREIALMKKRQSVAYADEMTLADAEDLAANFFIERKDGEFARGTVRVFMSNPTFVNLSEQVRFSTAEGLNYFPVTQQYIGIETVSSQRIGSLYYFDVSVIAENAGEEYNVPAGTIIISEGIPSATSVTNPFTIVAGKQTESKADLIERVKGSLTERSLTTKKGILARLYEDFDEIKSLEVVGFGDPEMERDVLTGEGDGTLLASGMSIIFGRYLFMVTGYEDNKNGYHLPKPGDKVKLNYWKFIYPTSFVETNYIQEVVYNSYGDIENIPTVHIFLLKNEVTASQPAVGALPGTFPGVFTSIFTKGTIAVSGVPQGIPLNSTRVLPTNEIHIGGRYDVWARPTRVSELNTSVEIVKTSYALQDLVLFSEGEPTPELQGLYPLNRLGTTYTLVLSSNSITEAEVIRGSTSQSMGFVFYRESSTRLVITQRTGSFSVGETITGATSGKTAVIQSIEYEEIDSDTIGGAVTCTSSNLQGTFPVLDIYENYIILNQDMPLSTSNIGAYTHLKTGIPNLFDPRYKRFPELADFSATLQSTIGSNIVTVRDDLILNGVRVGDTLDIQEGEDVGRYSINGLTFISSTKTEVKISAALTRTNSNVRYAVFSESSPVQAPLVNINPAGVVLSSDSGPGYQVPYAKPLGAYALGAFAGTRGKYTGENGFVMPVVGELFKGPGATLTTSSGNILNPGELALNGFTPDTGQYCISLDCEECEGLTVLCSATIDGLTHSSLDWEKAVTTGVSNVKFYIEGLVSPLADTYLAELRLWLKAVIDSFFRNTFSSVNQTVADDLDAFVDLFAPIILGAPPTNELVIKQFELCVPLEMFDPCNNVYIALPEYNWQSEFEDTGSFEAGIRKFLSGDMNAQRTALSYAKSGDALSITEGANKGDYVIHKVLNIPWYTGESISTSSVIDEQNNATLTTTVIDEKSYYITVVVIKGEFPSQVLKGSGEYFSAGIPSVSSVLPSIPSYLSDIQSRYIATGQPVNPFNLVEEAYSVLFKALYAQGMDLPDQLSVNPEKTLIKLVHTFFSKYFVGIRSSRQTTRMLFQDPCDVTVFSPTACTSISRKLEVPTVAEVTASYPVKLPNKSLGNAPVKVLFTKNSNQETITLEGVLPESAGDITNIADLVDAVQAEIDPSAIYVKVSYSVVNSENYIKLSGILGGEGSFISAQATSFSDGFGILGFSSSSWGPLSEISIPVAASFSSNPKFYNAFSLDTSSIGGSTDSRVFLQGDGFCILRVWDLTTVPSFSVGDMVGGSLVFNQNQAPPITITFDARVLASITGPVEFKAWVVDIPQTELNSIIGYQSTLTEQTIALGNMSSAVTSTQPSILRISVNSYPFLSTCSLSTKSISTFANANSGVEEGLNPWERSITGLSLINLSAPGTAVQLNGNRVEIDVSMPVGLSLQFTGHQSSPIIKSVVPSGFPVFELVNANHPESVISTLLSETLPMVISETDMILSTGLSANAPTLEVEDPNGVTTEILAQLSTETLTNIQEDFSSHGVQGLASALNQVTLSDSQCMFTSDSSGNLIIRSGFGSGTFNLLTTSTTSSPAASASILDHIESGPFASSVTSSRSSTLSNISVTSMGQGSSVAGTTSIQTPVSAHNGSRFSLTVGAESKQLVVDIEDYEEFYAGILPVKSTSISLDVSDLPRDCVFSDHYLGAETCTLSFSSGDGDSALSAGVLPGDLLFLHEQVCILDNAGLLMNPFSTKKDRVLAVRQGSRPRSIELLSTAGTFLSPESSTNNIIPPEDVVQVEDIVYFESLETFAIVKAVEDTYLILDRDVNANLAEVLTSGYDGTTAGTDFSSASYSFKASDVGLYLVIYGSSQESMDGTYEIDSVSSAGVATLSEELPTDANIHWALVTPDFSQVGESSIGGFSELKGLLPVRFYRGEAKKFTVGNINHFLERESSSAEILYGEHDGGPRRGFNQPYKIVRPSSYRITANQMEEQGKVEGMYYFDVPSTTLTPSFDMNVKEGTLYTPIKHTYIQKGYWLETEDRAHTFSSREKTSMWFDSAFLPSGSAPGYQNLQSPETSFVGITYTNSDIISSIQNFLSSDSNRNLNSDPLARHFLPSYVYITINADRASDAARDSIIEYIHSLSPTESLRLSQIEKFLHENSVHGYAHPIHINCVTHDLNRNIILSRSDDLIDDSTILHSGTNRLTYFIALEENITVG